MIFAMIAGPALLGSLLTAAIDVYSRLGDWRIEWVVFGAIHDGPPSGDDDHKQER